MYRLISNGVDYTDYVVSMSSSIAFADNTIIGNVSSRQFKIPVDNSLGVFNDILDQEFIIFDNDRQIGVFTIYEKPEKMTNDLSLVLYDNVVRTNIAYNSLLTYPSTIKDQLDEMSVLANVTIDYTAIPQSVLELPTNWWDNTLSIRQYLMYIGELSACNCFADELGNLVFETLESDCKFDLAEVDGVSKFSTIENFTVSKVIYDNGVGVVLECGDDSGSTYYLSTNNSYIENQEQVVNIAQKIIGLSITTMQQLEAPEIIGSKVGDIIRYYDDENTYYFMLMAIDIEYYNAEYNIMSASGKLETKAVENITNRANTATKVKKIETKIDNAEGRITFISKEVEESKETIGSLEVGLDALRIELTNATQSIYKIESGSGNIFDNCEYALIKTIDNPYKVIYSIPTLGIEKNFLKGRDIVISTSINVLNGVVGLGNKIGVEFDIEYKNAGKKTYVLYWYLGQYDLQYLLQTSTNDCNKRIWMHYKLDDEDIVSVSNLRMIVDLNAERAIVSNPKVEFGTTPTGFEYDMSYVRDNVSVLINQYAGIETTIEQLTAKVEKQEQDTINITTNVNGLKKEMDIIGLNVDSMNEKVFTNSDSIQAQIIETQNNYSSIVSKIDDLTIRTAHQEENVATITQTVTSLSNDLTETDGKVSNINGSIDTINGKIDTINSSIDNISDEVSQNSNSIGTVTAKVTEIVDNYTEINSKVDTLTLKANSQETKTIEIEKNVNGIQEKYETVESRLNSTEIALQPKNIVMAVNEQLGKDDAISTTSFTLDKNGAHIKNGALDITNSTDEKVFYSDLEGNLTVTGNIVGSKITGSQISFKNTDNGQSLELNETGIHIEGIQDTGSGGLGIHFTVLGEKDPFISIDEYGIAIDGTNASTLGASGGNLSLSTVSSFGMSPIIYSTTSEVWQGVMSDRINWLRFCAGTNDYVEITLDNSTKWGITTWYSDISLKENIEDTIVNALDRVNAIRHVDFNWIKNGCHVECGYIAQQLKEIDEEYVIPIEQVDGSILYQVSNETVTPLLSKAIQELSAKVDMLERRLEENGINY